MESSTETKHTGQRDQVSHHDENIVTEVGDELKQFYEPVHVWYAATVFPLSAACFGPMASALSICALIDEWRVFIPTGGAETTEVPIPDPPW